MKFTLTWPELHRWCERTAWDRVYWSQIRDDACEAKSDGCTGVPDWMVWTCWEHDLHYRTGRTADGKIITRRQADWVLRRRMQQASAWGVFYWRSWVRWIGVRLFGGNAWRRS